MGASVWTARLARLAAVVIALLAAGSIPAFAAGERVALVIGNGGYKAVDALSNPAKDAAAIAESLARIGFSVTHLDNLAASDMRRALQEFELAATGAEIALVYYAGHGIEVDGENYLIPVDATLVRDTYVEDEAIPLSRIVRAVDGASQLKLIMLDACRNNPFAAQMARTSAQRSIGRGLARVEPSGQTLVAYAAKGGTTAEDGDGEHSPFAAALLDHIETPGLEIDFLFRLVHDDVLNATDRRQEPFLYGALGATPIFLVPRGAVSTPETPPELAAQAPAEAAGDQLEAADYFGALRTNTEEAYLNFLQEYPRSARAAQVNNLLATLVENEVWESILDEDTVVAYQRYLAGFPAGTYADEATARVEQLLEERRRLATRDAAAPADSTAACSQPHGTNQVVGIASNDVLWVRTKPDRDATQVGSIPPGAQGIGIGRCVDVAGYQFPWCEVRYKCVSGWSYARFLEDAGGAAETAEETYRVFGVAADDVLNIRKGPGTGYPIVAAIPPNGSGITVSHCDTVAGFSNKWCAISWQSASGWASSCCLAGETTGRRPD